MISVVTSTIRENMLDRVIKNFSRQNLQEKELIIILNKNDIHLAPPTAANIRVFRLDESITLGECLNYGVSLARFEVISKMDDDDYYSPNYLANSLRQLQKTNAGVVGKAAIFVYFKKDKQLSIFRPRMNHCFLKNKKVFLAGGTLVFKKEVFKQVEFQHLNSGEDIQFQQDCLDQRYPLYSGSFHDYVLLRYEDDHHHSWQVENRAFQKHCKPLLVTERFEEYIEKGGRELL
ncbi:glycosyltransferase [Bacillus sp. 1P10SD]|uniref:glycosyltransferase family 2 protein n=1 Tax=Bacillus sp. 1P10SD TaxID=3132265 RepID=UPI0039A6D999